MKNNSSKPGSFVNVQGTELSASDTRTRYREKIARITLDSMVQFVGLLDASGTVLEINRVALDAVGIPLSDVEGKPFWTTFWWQVSDEINAALRASIARAAQGEFVRWETEIYGRAGDKETIVIDASLMPVRDDRGEVVFIAAEGRDISEKKAYEREIARQREELAQLDKLKTQFFANLSHEFRTPLTLWQTVETLEPQQAEATLRQSEERLRAFVTASSDVVYRMSSDWSEMHQLHGREFIADTEAPSREWLKKYIHPDDQQRVLAVINEAIRGRTMFELEHRVLRVDGTLGWTFSRAIPILDDRGEIIEWFGTASDITPRKVIEQALLESEEKNRTVLGSMDEGLMIAEVMFDASGETAVDYLVLETNEAFYKHTGLPQGMVGKTIREIIGTDAVPWLDIYGEVARSGQPIRFEYEIKLEPLTGWYDIFIQRIGQPKQHRVAVMFHDITERKRAERNRAFLADFSEQLLVLLTSREIVQVFGEQVADLLGASVCAFVEINEANDEAVICDEWRRTSGQSLVGRYDLPEYVTDEFRDLMSTGKPVVVRDVAEDPRIHDKEKFSALKIGSFVNVPYIRDGVWRFALGVYREQPYDWRDGEVALLIEVTSRIWNKLERARAEEQLRENERRWSLLVRLDDAIRALDNPAEITLTAARILGQHLGVDRCAYADIEADEDTMNLTGNYLRAPHIKSIIGRMKFADFGDEVLQLMREDKPYVVNDIDTHTPAVGDLTAYRATQIQAVICVPLHKRGRFVAAMAVHTATPRQWTADEVELVRLVAARCWESIERARVARELRESEERYRVVVNNQIEMLCRFRADGTILFVNAAYAKARGTTPETLIGANLWDFIPAEEHPAVQAMLSRLTPSSPEIHIENRFETAEGVLWTLWTNRGVIFDADGRLIEAQSSGIDITERKRMEEALKDADRRKDEFLAMLAHELRNPLAPIRNAIQVLRTHGPVMPDLEWARDVINRQVDQMTRLVDDLLDVSRITRNKIELRKQRVELRSVVNDAVEANRPLIYEREQTLSIDLPPEPIFLEADPTRISQVLLNLLNNAAKYTGRGGHIWLSGEQQGGQVMVRIKDDGIGIPPEMLAQIFEMFRQVDNSIERSQGGLGIGLTLVQRLVAMHGGEVEAFSQGQGKGSEFIVRLPIVETGESLAQRLSAKDQIRAAVVQQRILVVDDNEDSADSMALYLNLLGHEVRTAYDGLAAVEEAETFQPSVIILDIGLPKMNGYEVAEQLRKRRSSEVVLIALTGWGQEENRRRSKEAGFDHHFTKPLDFDDLNRLLAGFTH
jgi:PAS domain S-box-containing protein